MRPKEMGRALGVILASFLCIEIVVGVMGTAEAKDIEIVRPKSGQTFQSGDRLIVEVSVQNPALRIFLLVTPFGTVDFPSGLRKVELVIPPETVGTQSVMVVAKDQQMTAMASDEVSIDVGAPKSSALTALKVEPSEFFSIIPSTSQIVVKGVYSDGATRDVTDGAGTTFTSSNPSIVAVDEHGVMTAQASGTATITVRHQGKQARVTATVKADKELESMLKKEQW